MSRRQIVVTLAVASLMAMSGAAHGKPVKANKANKMPRVVVAGPSVDEMAAKATRIAIEDLVWPFAEECKIDDEVARRACLGVRDARLAARLTGTWIVTLPAKDKRGVEDCLACEPIIIAGQRWFVLDPDVPHDRAAGEYLIQTIEPKVRSAGADRLVSVASTRLGATEKAPDPPPANAPATAPALAEGTAQPAPATPAEEIPERLDRGQIQRAMATLRLQAAGCHRTYGIDGSAEANVSVLPDGTVGSVQMTGDLAGTPTGACLLSLVQKARFPKFKQGPLRVRLPFILR